MSAALADGGLTVIGRIAGASNTTVFAEVDHAGQRRPAVYKPIAGERPLWDFPRHTLAHREVAAYRLSQLAGLDVVPPTVLRDGPLGPGSVQSWVGPVPDERGLVARDEAVVVDLCRPGAVPTGWLSSFAGQDDLGREVVLCHADDDRLARLALFDAVANNADRKGGHVLRDTDGRLYGIDHGLTFHEEPKLRTVLWGWAGSAIPTGMLSAVGRIEETADLGSQFCELLDRSEIGALRARARGLLDSGRFPKPRRVWPAIPWPAL